ncbi:spx/MgsR family transcriptional regulator [Bacillus smithii 7_3_47FAA]|jgi:arsenate reductase|uniref:Spx/MgsR family transcriptional regulator n=2 Tax=Bacillaceae TaxID=186817 RepID=G9QH46_9BACI|nr:Arsenate reductase [Bacillus smithii]EHL79553.1 spx/MgsR family transcriptional regulator [Bacillus smithii 7_3_47FAA]
MDEADNDVGLFVFSRDYFKIKRNFTVFVELKKGKLAKAAESFIKGDHMNVTFYWYPKCATCRKAKKWLEDHQIDFQEIHIVDNPPSKEELETLWRKSGLELKKFFNTSGRKYRELGVKDRLKTASEDELLELLASDGMLIKRPIVTDGTRVTVGFHEDEFEKIWLNR